MKSVVIAGGGISGVYLAHKIVTALDDVKVYLVDPKPYHEFVMGIPMAFAGLVKFDDLRMSLDSLKRVEHVRDEVVDVRESGLKLASGEVIRGDYNVLAVGAFKIGDDFYSVEGAEAFYRAAETAPAVRFVIDELYPVMGFGEIAMAVKSLWPQKEVSIHLVYVHPDYKWLFEAFSAQMAKLGISLSEEPPPTEDKAEIHVVVPELNPHPLTKGLKVGPLFETQYDRTYLIGDTSLMKLGLPPLGWGAIWQASVLAQAIVSDIKEGAAEVEIDEWTYMKDPDKFKQYLTYRMTKGVPLVHLRGLYDLWRTKIFGSL
jgi:NADH dehydrogenase FAD-containing subunit